MGADGWEPTGGLRPSGIRVGAGSLREPKALSVGADKAHRFADGTEPPHLISRLRHI